jgi:hypothetical protein
MRSLLLGNPSQSLQFLSESYKELNHHTFINTGLFSPVSDPGQKKEAVLTPCFSATSHMGLPP